MLSENFEKLYKDLPYHVRDIIDEQVDLYLYEQYHKNTYTSCILELQCVICQQKYLKCLKNVKKMIDEL